MAYLEEVLSEFRKGAKIRRKAWSDDFYIYLYQGEIYWSDEAVDKDVKVTTAQALIPILTSQDDDWEFYQEPIDWDYIIKHKCLCWFWDEDENGIIVDTLTRIKKEGSYPYKSSCKVEWSHCRPVRRDEITFYEDKEK